MLSVLFLYLCVHICVQLHLVTLVFQGGMSRASHNQQMNLGYLYSLPGFLKVLILQLLHLLDEKTIPSWFRINPLLYTFL